MKMVKTLIRRSTTVLAALLLSVQAAATLAASKPNILVIW